MLSEMNESTVENFRNVKTLMPETQIDNSPIEKFCTTKKILMQILMEETKHVVMVTYEFKNREKLKEEGFFWNFRTIRILMQERK